MVTSKYGEEATSHTTALFEAGKRFYDRINEYKEQLQVGDVVWLPQEAIGIKPDVSFTGGFRFTVTAKYPYVVLLEKQTKRYGVHRQSLSYVNLLKYGKIVDQSIK